MFARFVHNKIVNVNTIKEIRKQKFKDKQDDDEVKIFDAWKRIFKLVCIFHFHEKQCSC